MNKFCELINCHFWNECKGILKIVDRKYSCVGIDGEWACSFILENGRLASDNFEGKTSLNYKEPIIVIAAYKKAFGKTK